jgi:hypothetical protein
VPVWALLANAAKPRSSKLRCWRKAVSSKPKYDVLAAEPKKAV